MATPKLPPYVIPDRKWNELPVKRYDDRLIIGEDVVMMSWELPLMERLASMLAARVQGSFLEIGFGMGLSATALQQNGITDHTIIEAHHVIAEQARTWRLSYPDRNIQVVEGYWQELNPHLGSFDGVLFDSYGGDQDTVRRERLAFIEHAGNKLLTEHGALALFLLSPRLEVCYQDALLRHFHKVDIEAVALSPVKELVCPELGEASFSLSVVASR